MGKYYQIYLNAETLEQSQDIVNTLTQKKLILGGTVLNGPTHFWWKGEEIDMDYYYVMAFTFGNKLEELEKEYKKVSVEEIPMMSVTEMRGNTEFLKLIKESIE